ncbi:MAG: hypothetical protein K0Q95_1867 [Bacteroidota bacterium]|jgi:hypothetical protein|nr:hypothetical protein [Bacteroidota bacterium]
MLRRILATWIKFLFSVIALSYWISFFNEDLGPKRTGSYAFTLLGASLAYAIFIEYFRQSKTSKEKVLITKNNLN